MINVVKSTLIRKSLYMKQYGYFYFLSTFAANYNQMRNTKTFWTYAYWEKNQRNHGA